jgi:hypothetical protein
MMLTPGPWRTSEHDDREIWTHDGLVFIATIACGRNAPGIAATPDLIGLVLELAEDRCRCGGAGSCPPCRAQRLVATFESSPTDDDT